MTGLSAQEVSLDVPKVTKYTHFVLLACGDVCWHKDTGVLEQQIADILDCSTEGCSMFPGSHKSNPSSVPRGYRRFVLCSTLGHVGGGNNCAGYNLMGGARHTLANGALVYPSQSGQ